MSEIKTESERKRLRREDETPEERTLRLEKQRERQRSSREAQSDQDTAKCREYQRMYQDTARQNETEERTAKRLEYKREHQASVRQDETENDRTVRLQSKTNLYVRSKALQSKRYLNIAKFHISSEVSDGLVVEHSIGSMTYNCTLCDAKFWEGEKLSTST